MKKILIVAVAFCFMGMMRDQPGKNTGGDCADQTDQRDYSPSGTGWGYGSEATQGSGPVFTPGSEGGSEGGGGGGGGGWVWTAENGYASGSGDRDCGNYNCSEVLESECDADEDCTHSAPNGLCPFSVKSCRISGRNLHCREKPDLWTEIVGGKEMIAHESFVCNF